MRPRSRPTRHVFPRLLCAGFCAVTVAAYNAATALGGDSLTAVFDWSMPDRIGLDRDPQDGVIDSFSSPRQVDPEAWVVSFDACDSTGAVTTYRWTVDGEPAGEFTTCDQFSWSFPAEGSYSVGLDIVAGEQSAGVEHNVIVQDWLIVALGDSYASGEGNPDLPISEESYRNWESASGTLEDAIREAAIAATDLGEARATFEELKALADEARRRRETLRAAERARDEACSEPPFFGCPAAEIELNLMRLELIEALTEPLLGVDALTLIENLDSIESALQNSEGVVQTTVDLAESTLADKDALRAVAQDSLDNALDRLESTWQDRRCHRSAKSGQALAALEIERADPRTSVTLVHLACSGARITTGLLLPDSGAEEAGPGEARLLPPQIEEMRRLVGNREIDAVVMSIGGNDARFSDVLKACVGYEPCHTRPSTVDDTAAELADDLCNIGRLSAFSAPCVSHLSDLADVDPLGPNAAEVFETALAGISSEECSADEPLECTSLEDRYAELQSRFASWRGLTSDRVYITEYPSVAIDTDGSFCSFDAGNPLNMLPGFSAVESMWAENVMLSRLNQAIADAATRNGWRYIGGIVEAFTSHGYCADDNWIVRLTESLLTQGPDEAFDTGATARVNGTAHPSEAGHVAYADRIGAALQAEFYPTGETTSPRLPRQATIFCEGDCNADGRVGIAEIISGVRIALGLSGGESCPGIDDNIDGRVSIGELIRAVNNSLRGCQANG